MEISFAEKDPGGPGGTQNPTGHSPEKFAVADPALNTEGWTRWSPELPSDFSCSVIL